MSCPIPSVPYKQPSELRIESAPVRMMMYKKNEAKRSFVDRRSHHFLRAVKAPAVVVGSVFNITKNCLKFLGAGTATVLSIPGSDRQKRFAIYTARYGTKTAFKVARLPVTILKVPFVMAGHLGGAIIPAVGDKTAELSMKSKVVGWKIQASIERKISRPYHKNPLSSSNLNCNFHRLNFYDEIENMRGEDGKLVFQEVLSYMVWLKENILSSEYDKVIKSLDFSELTSSQFLGVCAYLIVNCEETSLVIMNPMLNIAMDKDLSHSLTILDFWAFAKQTIPKESLEHFWGGVEKVGKQKEVLEIVSSDHPRLIGEFQKLEIPELNQWMQDHLDVYLKKMDLNGLKNLLKGVSPDDVKRMVESLNPEMKSKLYQEMHIVDPNNVYAIAEKVRAMESESELSLIVPVIPNKHLVKMVHSLPLSRQKQVIALMTKSQRLSYLKAKHYPESTGVKQWKNITQSYWNEKLEKERENINQFREEWFKARNGLRMTLDNELQIYRALYKELEAAKKSKNRVKFLCSMQKNRITPIEEAISEIKEMNQNFITESPPEKYMCPIGGIVMIEPVIDSDGNIFEREQIERWLKEHGESPLTRNKMKVSDLKPEENLKKEIAEYLESLKNIT